MNDDEENSARAKIWGRRHNADYYTDSAIPDRDE
jgi:hypothetical protein